uniref:Integrase catalytic domain-containing protein n=1 Tax=Tanacetum cinerariifolium TaxID=118510 RepID=A0A6L2LI12_TANCI|nr:hypothetical protein [Tanacetum cinerariifolium]
MAHPVQNINHSAFRSMFKREKLSGNNFSDWFRQLKLVLRVEKKIFVIEQPIPPIPAADSATNVLAEWNALYDAHNKVASLMFGNQLERLGYVLPQDLTVGLILNSLTKDFARFVRNYNMHNMGKTIDELYAMLIEYKKGLPKKAETPQVRMIKVGKIQKSNKKSLKAKGKGKTNGKGKDKQVYIPKPKNPKPAAKEHPTKDNTYLAELIKKKKQVGTGSSSNIFVIELFSLPSKSWVYDTSCGTLICNTQHGLRGKNVHYFHVIPSNGIYEIDMHDLVPNVNSIFNVSTKRAKHNLDSTYLWHCRLAHISKKCIKKLQHEGFLKSTNDESFDQCVSCLSGKMTRKSFPHRLERVTDLLGIIHTDVFGPLRHLSRRGASYFITFTDDYSRYGYVYLLKHKHDVFETFKVFKNEVKNQLGKIIKALQSDRGGEYVSQKFKDYLKACGIVQQLTPAYTPQHNGVSERRNHTLLYMVDKTPYELWYEKVPNLSYLKVWGCEAHVKRDTIDKLQQRSVKCIFIGYPKETMGYYFYFSPENKIVVARYAKFFERNLITQEVSGRAIDLEEIQDKDTTLST